MVSPQIDDAAPPPAPAPPAVLPALVVGPGAGPLVNAEVNNKEEPPAPVVLEESVPVPPPKPRESPRGSSKDDAVLGGKTESSETGVTDGTRS